jgi:hypothetical protein
MQTRNSLKRKREQENNEDPKKTTQYGYFTPLIDDDEIDIEETDNESESEYSLHSSDEDFISDHDDVFEDCLYCDKYGILEFVRKHKLEDF